MTTNELTLSSDLPTLTAEINAYKRVAGEAIFEIGRRLKHIKENDLAHGQYLDWLRSVEIHERQAQRIIRVTEEFDGNTTMWSGLPFRSLYEIATLPPEERTRGHTLSSGATKTPDEMTVRELREVKAALKAERERAEKAESDYETVRDTLESMRDHPPQVEYVYVENAESDP